METKQETLEEFINVELEGYDEIDFSTYERFIELGAKWQQEQDNKELAMWKLAVERQEARCKALHGVISDLQERMYSEEEVYKLLSTMPNFFNMTIPQQTQARKDWFEQFKKK